MKSNAIIRIIVFSILIVLLSGLFLAGLNLDRLLGNVSANQGELTVGPVASDESATKGAVSADKIGELEIEWAAGKILIQPSDETDTIRFWDDYTGEERYYLFYTTQGNKLSIQFCKDLDWDDGFGMTLNNTVRKNLTIQVPAGWICESLEVDAASATLEVHDLTIQEAEIDTASGALGFENCNVYSLDVDTDSGDLIFTGSLQTLDCDAASASVAATLDNIPTRINVSTMSSNIDLTLPENTGFTLNMDGLSSTMHSDFDCTLENGRYVCGDGSCHIHVDSLSGKVYLRKNTNLTSNDIAEAEETQPHMHSQLCFEELSSCPYYAMEDHRHSESCTNEPSTCPYYLLGGHEHGNTCVNDPATCPYYTMEGHRHSENCTSNHEACPYYALGDHCHSENCTKDPASCPANCDGTHQHSDNCVLNPGSCAHYSGNGQQSQIQQGSGAHDGSGSHHGGSSGHH